jgi:hypothetical protein
VSNYQDAKVASLESRSALVYLERIREPKRIKRTPQSLTTAIYPYSKLTLGIYSRIDVPTPRITIVQE